MIRKINLASSLNHFEIIFPTNTLLISVKIYLVKFMQNGISFRFSFGK